MYINLKVYTDYTLLEGVGKISDYVKKVSELGLKGLGLVDKSMCSAMKMYNLCKKNNINLLMGLTVFVYGVKREGKYILTLYAKGEKGYKELVNLSSLSYRKKGVLDISDISKCNNILVTTGSLNSEVYVLMKDLEYSTVREVLKEYSSKFKDIYLELPCFLKDEKRLAKYIEISKEMDVELIAVNDTFYLQKEDRKLQKIVARIGNKKWYEEKGLYFKTEEEIREDLSFLDKNVLDKAIENTEKILEEYKMELDLSSKKVPKLQFDIPQEQYLKNLVYDNLAKKYTKRYDEAKKRADYELEIISKMGFNGYFLIVEDIVRYARQNDILVGPGRGSASGSIVSYLLGITKVDPLKYDLMFERFLNIARKNMPDIDLDFETAKKDKIIQYVMDKYGKDYVSNIITFSTMKEKALIKDLKRVFKNRENKYVIDEVVEKLKGNVRHSSIHPSGVIISSEKLTDIVPINFDSLLNVNITQYQMEELETMGLLKMDFLSLSNLDILSSCTKLTNIKLDDIPLDDKNTFEEYNKGKTLGIFQVEARGITELIKRYIINEFQDISTVLALYRPGPLKSGMIDKLISIKNGNGKVEYLFPQLEEVLSSTYGVIIYQEQVMKIARIIAGFDLNEADDLRKAISKKKMDILENYKKRFIEDSVNRGFDRSKVEVLYNQIEKFGEYGFNKSHTIPYAMLSYYTAYFKTNYTKEFFCSYLNSQLGIHDNLKDVAKEVNILKPDINLSDVKFTVEKDGIRYGLCNISGISVSFSNDILNERKKGKFLNILDFCYRLLEYGITKKQCQILADAGVFDSFCITRKEVVLNVDEIYSLALKKKEQKEDVCRTIFFDDKKDDIKYIQKDTKEYEILELLDMEEKMLGLKLSFPREEVLNVIKNKHIFLSEYNLVLKNGLLVKLSEIGKHKASITNILLDNVDEDNLEKLKKYILKNGGYSKVVFYKQKQKLPTKTNRYIYLSKKNIEELISIVGKNNLRIELK